MPSKSSSSRSFLIHTCVFGARALAGSSARCREGNRLYLDKLIRIAENRDA
jgi:hypothetical protein